MLRVVEVGMPEIFRLEGYVFSFYSNEGNNPLHVHMFGKPADLPNSSWSRSAWIILTG